MRGREREIVCVCVCVCVLVRFVLCVCVCLPLFFLHYYLFVLYNCNRNMCGVTKVDPAWLVHEALGSDLCHISDPLTIPVPRYYF